MYLMLLYPPVKKQFSALSHTQLVRSHPTLHRTFSAELPHAGNFMQVPMRTYYEIVHEVQKKWLSLTVYEFTAKIIWCATLPCSKPSGSRLQLIQFTTYLQARSTG